MMVTEYEFVISGPYWPTEVFTGTFNEAVGALSEVGMILAEEADKGAGVLEGWLEQKEDALTALLFVLTADEEGVTRNVVCIAPVGEGVLVERANADTPPF